MRETRVAWRCGVLALALGLVAHPAAAADKLHIDYIDTSEFVATGNIRLYVDLLDGEFNVIEGLEDGKVQIFVDGKAEPGSVFVDTFEQAKEYVSVALLLAGHRSYGEPATYDETGELVSPARTEVLDLQKAGFASLARKLDGNDRLAVYLYNERDLFTIDDWSEDHEGSAESIMANVKAVPAEGDAVAPKLFKYLKEVVDKKIGEADDLKRRRILIMMSDGQDSRPKKRERTTKAIVEAAKTHDVKVYVIGFTEDDPQPLNHIKSLASKTGGIYRRIEASEKQDIPIVLENIARELKKQYVITWRPEEFAGDNEQAFEFRLELETPKGRHLEDTFSGAVRVPELPTNWGGVLRWLGVIVGVLLGLFLLVRLVKLIIRWRGNRSDDGAYEGPTGPYRCKLTCRSGLFMGAEFYLSEEVTTVGSLPGNGVVLHDDGVSKRHCGIKIDDMRFELADFGSTNGTTVNGMKITKQFLRDGDVIGVGGAQLVFTLK